MASIVYRKGRRVQKRPRKVTISAKVEPDILEEFREIALNDMNEPTASMALRKMIVDVVKKKRGGNDREHKQA